MYREPLRACPGCLSPMQAVRVVIGAGEAAVLEMCGACGGGFFDYFAGELAQLARSLVGSDPAPARLSPLSRPPECPDCADELLLAQYLGDGPLLYRCDGCLAAFVTARQLQLLAEYSYHRKAAVTVLRALGERLGFV